MDDLLSLHFLSSQIVWVAFSFLTILALISFYVLPRFNAILDERSSRIKADLDAAFAVNKKAQELLEEYEVKLQNAHEESEELMRKTKEKSSEHTASQLEELKMHLNAQKKTFENMIAAETKKAKLEIKEELSEIILNVCSKVITTKLNEKDISKEVDVALKEIEASITTKK